MKAVSNVIALAGLVVTSIGWSVANIAVAENGNVIVVSSSAELDMALTNARGGDTIRLNPGTYTANISNSPAFQIAGRDYTDFVTIESANPSNRAQFSSIRIVDSSYIKLNNLKVVVNGREGIGIFNGSHHVQLLNTEIHGANRFDRRAPNYTQVSSTYGVYVNGNLRELVSRGFPATTVSNVVIQNNTVQDIKSSGYLFSSMENSIVKGNKCDWMAADCYKLATVDGLDFVNNFGARNIYASPDAHVDFVQGQGPVSNSRFIGNVALAGSAQSFQGLFFDDATYSNLTFENNLIHTASIRGISVSSPRRGTPSSGIVARFNTVLRPAVSDAESDNHKASDILIPSGSINENNIVSNITTRASQRLRGTSGRETVVAQYDRADRDFFYNRYYKNATRGRGATIADFAPITGSYGESKGAFVRINQLLADAEEADTGDAPSVDTPSQAPQNPRENASEDGLCFPISLANGGVSVLCL